MDELCTSEIRYGRLLETAQDGVLILDCVTRRIRDANPVMVEMLGYSRAELLEKELWEIGLLTDTKANRQAFQELQKKRGYIRYEDLPLQIKATAKEAGSGICRQSLCRRLAISSFNATFCGDITERKLEEQRLRKANNTRTHCFCR